MEKKPANCDELVAAVGGKFSAELGIDLASGESGEVFKWLLASVLFGARISAKAAARTYRVFSANKIHSAQALNAVGEERLVSLLDAGGYARYDFKTAKKLSTLAGNLVAGYGGSPNRLRSISIDEEELEKRLRALAPGIGRVTCDIFLRELRGIWELNKRPISTLARLAAQDLGFLSAGEEAMFHACGRDPGEFEAALIRWGLALSKKRTINGE